MEPIEQETPMGDILAEVFGQGETLAWWQMAARAALIFVAAWIMLRGAGRRAFSQQTPFDLCIMLLLGAVLSRAVVGASPIGGTLAASLVLVALHRSLGSLASRFPGVDRIIAGHRIDLLQGGRIDQDAMRRAMLSAEDLQANLRASLQSESLAGIQRIVVERNGKVTFVRRQEETEHA
ncbi:DUF421 domain-containing protein [Cupriavidus plantarum]|nr:YetF domain-containing protein [Cupriavidus plantarum]